MKTICIYTEKYGYMTDIKPLTKAEFYSKNLRYLFSDNAEIGEEINVYEERFTGEFMKKVDIIFNWLKQGERVVRMGKADGFSNYIVKHENNFAYSRFGSSAVKATKKDLSWLLTEIFDPDDEFYIITDDGKMLTTNKLTDTACNVAYTFTLYARDIFTYKETPLQQFRGNFAKVLKTYVQIAECYNDQHKENHVHFALSCENPFFNYWNFAI